MKTDSAKNPIKPTEAAKLLLWESGELQPEQALQANDWISTDDRARKYLQELEDLKSMVDDLSPADDVRTFASLNFVANALKNTDVKATPDTGTTESENDLQFAEEQCFNLQRGREGTTQLTEERNKPKRKIHTNRLRTLHSSDRKLVALTGIVAVFLGAVAIYSIAFQSPPKVMAANWNPNRVAGDEGKSGRPADQPADLKPAATPVSPKRRKINFHSSLLTKIQLSRAKMNNFRKRIRKRS